MLRIASLYSRVRERTDRVLICTIAGFVIALFVALKFIYLATQMAQFLFLLIGWLQSVQLGRYNSMGYAQQPAGAPRVRYERVLT